MIASIGQYLRISGCVPLLTDGLMRCAANAMKGDKEKCIAAGMDDYISKPVEKKRLEEVLARWLNVSVVSAS